MSYPENAVAWVIPHCHFWLNADGTTRQDYIDEGIHNTCDCPPVIAQLREWFQDQPPRWFPFGDERPFDEGPSAIYSVDVLRVIDVGGPTLTADALLKQAKHDVYYYRNGRHHEREWIVAWLRKDPQFQGLANRLERLEDLDGVPEEEASDVLGPEMGAGPTVQHPEGDGAHQTVEGEQMTVYGGGEAVLKL